MLGPVTENLTTTVVYNYTSRRNDVHLLYTKYSEYIYIQTSQINLSFCVYFRGGVVDKGYLVNDQGTFR